MAKVFTITEGLENLGALKTGGQGSIYKARRTGEIISAVKILPTPVHSESDDDKNFRDFRNEVSKLQMVNERPNPRVVRILGSGITDTGSFPFIEMEFIEGPDLEELLQPPHEKIFTVHEAVRVAEDLANALAHCHRVEVRHGDIKSNNVKFNLRNGHYVLLDFGMSALSDEQRRTSLRQAGAIEFMAPEQHRGELLFQTDIYSFGIVLYELLAGQVPFPLGDKGEMARNKVMVSHMEATVPDLLKLRKENLPEHWPDEKKYAEMQVPGWLLETISRCLQKDPAKRFTNGIELENQVLHQRISDFDNHDMAAKALAGIQREAEDLRKENIELKKKLAAGKQKFPRRSFNPLWLILLLIFLGAAAYLLLQNRNRTEEVADSAQPQVPKKPVGYFRVNAARAYFHNEPDAATRREAYMIPSFEVISGLEEKNGFIYTVFTNSNGQTSRGWLKKSDLAPAGNSGAQNAPVPVAGAADQRLADAETLVLNGNPEQAAFIYRQLADEQHAEAMYQLANLGLKRMVAEPDCAASLELLEKAAGMGLAAAKRTLGFLLVFADKPEIMRANEYDDCSFERNVFRGTNLLREARASGDALAVQILDQLNLQ